MKPFNSLRKSWILTALYTPWLIYALSKLKWLLRVVWLFCRPLNLAPEWPERLTWCLGVIFVWAGLSALFTRLLRRLKLQIPITVLLLSLGGLGICLLLIPMTLKIPIGPKLTLGFLICPFVFCLFYFLHAVQHQPVQITANPPENNPEEHADWGWRFLNGVSLVIIGLATVTLLGILLWLILLRGKATGDELYYWWSASQFIRLNGATRYVAEFYPSHYSPGYPLLANAFLSFVPGRWFIDASFALPFLFGALVMAILFYSIPGQSWNRRRIAVLVTAGALLFVSHLWVYALCFQKWYGEALAIGVIASIFLAIDGDTTGQMPAPLEGLLLFGLGVTAQLSKPPVETLLLPALIPCLLLFTWLTVRSRPGVKITFRRLLILALGALCAKLLWTHVIALAGKSSYYYIEWVKPTFNPALIQLIVYFFCHYPQIWLTYLIFITAAILMDRRRFLPSIAASLILVTSIFWLYATVWKKVNYESGGRYILHGTLGWILYFIVVQGTESIRIYGQTVSLLIARYLPSRAGRHV